MKKVLIIIGIVLVVAGLVCLGTGLFKKNVRVLDGPDMVYKPEIKSVDYYCGGGELGDYCHITLNDEAITIVQSEGNGEPETSSTYNVGIDLYNALDKIIYDNNMREWTELPKSELQVLDRETTAVTIEFEDGLIISFSTDDELPDYAGPVFAEIKEVLGSVAQ